MGLRKRRRALAATVTLGAGALLSASIKTVPLQFTDVADSAGIRAVMRCGGLEKRWIPEANGSGAAWLDYDNDGFMDLLIVNGGTMDQFRSAVQGEKPTPIPGSVYLYHNLGNGHFEDVTAKSGLFNSYWGTGANAADYNNDGFTDILITTIGRDLLFKNNGDGTFSEVSSQAGFSQRTAWHTGSAFGDFDGDGKLDLFITGYIDIHSMPWSEPAPVCDYFGQHVFCGPIGFKGEHSMLYRNNGNGTFTDISQKAGLTAVAPAHGFTPVTGDFNNDGKLDVFVANDSDPNYLFLNQGDGSFREKALDQGVAFNADGRTQSNMGVAIGEYGHSSGKLDVLTTTFNKDYFPLFRQSKSGTFEEVASATGLTTLTQHYLGWACGLTDFANSGSREFWSANGHVYPTDKDYFEPITILRSEGNTSTLAFSFPQRPDHSYRGGSSADFDNDGRIDLIALPVSGSPVLLRNGTAGQNSWIGLTLRGTRSNRDAIGAKVVLESCGAVQREEVRSGGSYLSRNDPRLHFGLGTCSKVDRLTILWPDGESQSVATPAINKYSIINENSPGR